MTIPSFHLNKKDVQFGPVCLVTGGAGFLGSILINRLLNLGLQVRSFDVVEPEIEHKNLESLKGDIRQIADLEKACDGVDTVFHAVAVICMLGTYRQSIRDRIWGINVTGTENLLAAAEKAGVKAFVHTSSHNVCMDRELFDGTEDERYAQTFIDLYTETKTAAEKLALAADGRSGMRTAAIRPGGIWGPGTRSILINKTIEQVVAGKFVATLGDPKALTDCSHVDNVCDGEILAAQKLMTDPDTVGGQAYFITDEEPYNQLRWSKPLIEKTGYKFPSINLPGAPFYGIATILEYLHFLGLGPEPELTRSAIWKMTKNYSVSCKKAKKELGYVPRFKRDTGLEGVIPFAKAYAERLESGQGKVNLG